MLFGEGNGTPLRYSCLENPMDGGAWSAAVHGVAKSRARLSDFTFTFHFHALEKEMTIPSSVLAWRIPGTGEPGGLPSMGSQSQKWLKRLSSSSIIDVINFSKILETVCRHSLITTKLEWSPLTLVLTFMSHIKYGPNTLDHWLDFA